MEWTVDNVLPGYIPNDGYDLGQMKDDGETMESSIEVLKTSQ